MSLLNKHGKDNVYRKAEQGHLMTIAFLSALKNSVDSEKAFEIATRGFTNYMINYYNIVLDSTIPGTQERFDKFREHYEGAAKKVVI